MRVFLIAAITADGFIGKDANHLADWTSKEDKRLFVRLTKEAGTLVMGARTFATIGRGLPGRRLIVYTNHPEQISADGAEATNESPLQLCDRLRASGATGVAVAGGASIYNLFMQAGVVDELYLTMEPVIFGGGVPLFTSGPAKKLELLDVQKLNEDSVLFHYAVRRG
jgi:dihydrofolate reductase